MSELSVLRPFTEATAQPMATLLSAQSPDYLKGFFPFDFDTDTLRGLVQVARRDRYWTIMDGERIAGLVFLRGFDSGFERPSFGIVVAQGSAGRHLARKALAEVIAWAKDIGVPAIFLKVAEDNRAALELYRKFGFRFEGRCPKTGHLTHILQLTTS